MVVALIKLALRNVFRNRRRSGLTLATVVIGLAALFFLQSLVKSLHADLVNVAINTFTTHMQIQSKKSEDPKIPEASFSDPDRLESLLKADPRVKVTSRRVVFTGLVSSAANSMGIAMVGIDPETEKQLSNMSSYVKKGRFVEGPKEVIVGKIIAKNLDIRIGEKIVLMAQNREGSFEGRALRVVGVYETGSYTFDSSISYMFRQDAQEILGWGSDVNILAVKLKDIATLEEVHQDLSPKIEALPGLKLLTWKEVSSEIVHIREFQNAVLFLVIVVVFIIVALGILNTMLMSLFERIREFGLMMALGAKRKDVAVLLLTESACLGGMGLFWGALWGLSIIGLFHFIGLPLPLGEALSYFLPFEKNIYLRFVWAHHAIAVGCVITVSILAGIIPALRVIRLRPAEALRHV